MKRSTAILMLSTAIISSSFALPMTASAATQAVASSQSTSGTIVSGVNLRDKPSLSGKVVGFVKKDTKVTILEQATQYFYRVKTSNGMVGYISASPKYIKVSEPTPATPEQPAPSVPETSNKIDQVIATGMKYFGTPYEYGSNRNKTTTFDCSAFVRNAFKEALNIVLPADSRKQGEWIQNNSTAVYNISQLKRGDLLFFMSYKGSSDQAYAGVDKSKERITHVAIYLGNGEILHTYSNASGGVRTDKLTGSWVKRFLYGGSVLQ